jgi:hypothetical protein
VVVTERLANPNIEWRQAGGASQRAEEFARFAILLASSEWVEYLQLAVHPEREYGKGQRISSKLTSTNGSNPSRTGIQMRRVVDLHMFNSDGQCSLASISMIIAMAPGLGY